MSAERIRSERAAEILAKERIRLGEVVELLGISRKMARAYAAAGRLPSAMQLGRTWTFDPKRLDAWDRSGRPVLSDVPLSKGKSPWSLQYATEEDRAKQEIEAYNRLAVPEKIAQLYEGVAQPLRWIYFIQGERTRLIKIGVANNYRARFNDIQVYCPDKLILLAVRRGSLTDEQNLHKRFAEFRQHGEWFLPAEPILTFIKKHARKPRL